MRGPDFAERLCAALGSFDPVLDMRIQIRLEVSCHETFERARDVVKRHGVDALVLNDRLPHEALSAGKRPPRLDGQAIRAGRSPADHLALMRRLHDEMPLARIRLAPFMASLEGVRIGSHDDGTPQDRSRYRTLGARIAEFPMNRETAMAAKAAGDAVVLGAPNIVRGGSHGKGVRARALVASGLCDALASDYHYPALHRSALGLADDDLSLAEAWALVSTIPARIMGLCDRGTIEPGQRADLVILEEETRRIAATISGGRIAFAGDAFARRLLA